MKYFGIPYCPHCKKRANIINLWSIKKHGEYMCPRCKKISNIFLSPLIYVFAIMAIALGFFIYFFDRFLFEGLNLYTPIKVIVPFLAFFVLSLFLVYFKKPVIKKFRRDKNGRIFDSNGVQYVNRMGRMVPLKAVAKPAPRQPVQNRQNVNRADDMFVAVDEENNADTKLEQVRSNDVKNRR